MFKADYYMYIKFSLGKKDHKMSLLAVKYWVIVDIDLETNSHYSLMKL